MGKPSNREDLEGDFSLSKALSWGFLTWIHVVTRTPVPTIACRISFTGYLAMVVCYVTFIIGLAPNSEKQGSQVNVKAGHKESSLSACTSIYPLQQQLVNNFLI